MTEPIGFSSPVVGVGGSDTDEASSVPNCDVFPLEHTSKSAGLVSSSDMIFSCSVSTCHSLKNTFKTKAT